MEANIETSTAGMKKRYAGLMTYVCDDVRYKRKDNDEAWTTVGEGGIKMFYSYPYFEFIPGTKGDEEPIRYGDFVIDIDTKELAMGSAVKIIDWFQAVYGVDPEQWRIYLSGKKGVHLELPAEILGMEAGHKLLPLGYKRLAKDIEGELHLALDTSMYNRGTGKPYRRPNVYRTETGTCKRQITPESLYEITDEEEYTAACSEPGPVWEPEEISLNGSLSAKVRIYLQEAIQQQELIKLAPVLTDQERGLFHEYFPPCMKIMSRLTLMAGKPHKTFNDIAIQLTAFAVTAGISELDFLGGCGIFIENYPSSSLNTVQKRYQNCRARYRTMAANGNQHSCGGVLALGISGYDCSTCGSRTSVPNMVGFMADEDIKRAPLMLNIPVEVSRPGGLIDLGMEALSSPGMPNIEQYNLPVILTNLANAISGKLTFNNQSPNVFNIKVGPTSSGKTSSDITIVDAINNTPGLGAFYGPTDFASGPALMRAVMDKPVQQLVIDEATNMFKRYDKSDPIGDGKRDALLELFSKSGGKIEKAYADSRNTITIIAPCVSLTGNATMTIFDAIKDEDFNTGIMQRFDFWCYDGPVPQRGIMTNDENKKLIQFAEGIAKIRAAVPNTEGNLTGLNGARFAPFKLGITEDGAKILQAWSTEMVTRTNAAGSDGEGGIISRAYNLSIKYAMIHHAATKPIEALFSPLDEQDILYGQAVAWMLADWKINVLRGRVTTGQFHQMCEIFLAARDAAQKNGKRPTFVSMTHRRPQMKNWKPKESAEVIEVLVKREEIVLDESKKPTAYYRPKQTFAA